jgi:hypothetical protein
MKKNEIIYRRKKTGRPYSGHVSVRKLRTLKVSDKHERLRSLVDAFVCLENHRKRVQEHYRDLWMKEPSREPTRALSKEFLSLRSLRRLTQYRVKIIHTPLGPMERREYRWTRADDSLIFDV